MHDYSYSAHLVINDGYEDRLDMKISCQNAQQLLRARDSFSDQMNTYIAEFAMQSNLVRMPSNEEQNTAALQAIIPARRKPLRSNLFVISPTKPLWRVHGFKITSVFSIIIVGSF